MRIALHFQDIIRRNFDGNFISLKKFMLKYLLCFLLLSIVRFI
jgi:hypothetical protein